MIYFLAINTASAVVAVPTPKSLQSAPMVTTANPLLVLLSLLLVVGIILALAWLLKRINSNSFGLNQPMKVLSSVSLGGRERLLLVDVSGTQMLLGVSPGRVAQLHVFEQPVVVAGEAATAVDFSARLQQFLQPGGRS